MAEYIATSGEYYLIIIFPPLEHDYGIPFIGSRVIFDDVFEHMELYINKKTPVN